MKLTFLGTSGAVARAERDNVSLLFRFGTEYLLVDTPGALVHKLSKINLNYFRINQIFLTHTHPDHIYGLPSFIHSRMFDSSSLIHIYGHPRTLKLVERLFKLFSLKGNRFPKIKLVELKSGDSISPLKGIHILSFKVKHAPESLGIKIETSKKKVVFSSDSAYSRNLAQMAKEADYLIHDCFAPERFFRKYPQLHRMHSSPRTLARVAQQARPKLVIPIHFSGEFKFELEEIKKELEQKGVEKIHLPRDLESIAIS